MGKKIAHRGFIIGSDLDMNNHAILNPSGLGAYVDRGDPGDDDFEKTDLTIDGAWHELDLSSIVPAGVKVVHLSITLLDDAVNSELYVRKNGNSNIFNALAQRTSTANSVINIDGFVACDVNRKVEYLATNVVWTGIWITVRGWII